MFTYQLSHQDDLTILPAIGAGLSPYGFIAKRVYRHVGLSPNLFCNAKKYHNLPCDDS